MEKTRVKIDEIRGLQSLVGPNFPDGATFRTKKNVPLEFSRVDTSEIGADQETIEVKRIGLTLYWRSSAVTGSPWVPFA